ncbi:hypothetical protein OPQ81_011603 [Rhizoctonia solani]|nr:hypothetical protein OPQ81_011603 [Rhizoctonia solani]
MSWFRKKKQNPEDGDFPVVPKHYQAHQGKTALTKPIKLTPALQWNGGPTVVWGIDVGSQATTVSFAYLLSGESVEVHNIIYWPKVFPLRESGNPGESLPDAKEKTYKIRETYESIGFVSNPAWPSQRTFNYVHVAGAGSSPSAFQVRTELPFIEVTNERHKYVDLVEHLLKHALSVYGAVIKPGQPQWPRASDVVISLPGGISKSAEISVIDALNEMIQNTMPKVIGLTQVYYVPKPDLRPFEDDTWRNLDTNFQHNDTFMIVDWNLTMGDMVCASYKARQLPNEQITFDIQQRSYLNSTPVIRKRDVSADGQEGTRFANALHWVAEQKHTTQKIIIRVSNPFKKSEGLLASFHKVLTELGLQVGIRLVDPTTETGALGAVLWRVARAVMSSGQPTGEGVRRAQDTTSVASTGISTNVPELSQLELGGLPGNSRVVSSFHSERGSRSGSTAESSATFVSTPPSGPPYAILPATPVTRNSHLFTSQFEVTQAADKIVGSSNIPGSPEDQAANPTALPPAYIDKDDDKSYPPEKQTN